MKRVFDLVAGTIALVLLSPVLVIVAVLVAVKLGRPVLFVQARPGLDGKSFRMIKFRTMTAARHPDGALLPDDQRLLAFGRWLRSTSLDELPELFNVVVGDMSLVGPRPLLVEYLPLYNAKQARRHEVRPGITGLAQVSGRNAIGWDAKFDLDVEYIEHRSLMLDLRILWATIWRVIRREGVSADGEATMPAFVGNTGAPFADTAAAKTVEPGGSILNATIDSRVITTSGRPRGSGLTFGSFSTSRIMS